MRMIYGEYPNISLRPYDIEGASDLDFAGARVSNCEVPRRLRASG